MTQADLTSQVNATDPLPLRPDAGVLF